MTSDQPTNNANIFSKKIRKTWLIWAIILAVLVILFLTFRPITKDDALVKDDGEVKVYQPVVYDTAAWQKAAKTGNEIESLKAQLGSTATTEEALDFMVGVRPVIALVRRMSHRFISLSQRISWRWFGIMLRPLTMRQPNRSL